MAGRPSPFWAHPGRTRYRCAAAAPCHPRGPGLPGAGTCRPARRYTWHVPPVDLGWTLADPPRTGRTGPPDRQTNTHAARIVTLGEQLAVTRWYARTETHSSRYRPTTTSGLACGSGLIENFRPDSPTTRSQPRGARGGARRPGGSRPAPSRRGSPGTLCAVPGPLRRLPSGQRTAPQRSPCLGDPPLAVHASVSFPDADPRDQISNGFAPLPLAGNRTNFRSNKVSRPRVPGEAPSVGLNSRATCR